MRKPLVARITLGFIYILSAHLNATRVDISLDEINIQSQNYPSGLDFYEALQIAIVSYLSDSDDSESPLALLKRGNFNNTVSKNILDSLMNDQNTYIKLSGATEPIAPRKEEIERNWIFRLYIPELSDHCFYAIVDRYEAVPAYNYGFN